MRYQLQYIHLQFTQNHISKHTINFGYILIEDLYLYQWHQWLVCHIKHKPRALLFNIWTFDKIIDFMDPPFCLYLQILYIISSRLYDSFEREFSSVKDKAYDTALRPRILRSYSPGAASQDQYTDLQMYPKMLFSAHSIGSPGRN